MRLPLRASLSALSIAAVLVPAVSAQEASSSASSASSSSLSSLAPIQWNTVIPKLPSSCVQNPNKDLCIPDHIRNLERARLDFVNEMARLRQNWIADHAGMGRTTEYLVMLQQFSNHLKREGDIFANKINDAMREVSANRTNRRGRGSSSSSVSSSSRSKAPVNQETIKKCNALKDPLKQRLCIRAVERQSQIRTTTRNAY
jgi:hypothetical protein